MKHFKILCIFSFFIFFSKNYASLPAGQPADAANFLKKNTIDSKVKPLLENTRSNPALGIRLGEDGTTHVAQQYIQNRSLKHTTNKNVQNMLKKGNFSVLRGKDSDYDNYPTGAALFKDYPSLAAKFDKLIAIIKKEPKFKSFFNKVHLNILNELYEYLMGIYTNFNVQHVGIKEVQTKDGQTALQLNIPTFLQDESEYEANKKTLIINHMVNIIESQMNGKIKSISPQIPHLFATSAGKTLIQNDFSVDLTHFIIKQIEPQMIQAKKKFLEGLVVYLSFFQEFTSYLLQPHPKHSEHFSAFVHIAESINQFIYGDEDPKVSKAEDKVKTLLSKMDPPLFTFNYDDIRALRLIPTLAKSMNPDSKNIQWPSHLVEAANGIAYIKGHPIAYFTDSAGNVVKEDQAKHLYVVMQSGKNFFQEELKPQPDWLNSWDGCVNILRACFGDFSALLKLEILDPCMEALIQNTVDTMNGKDVNESGSFDLVCKNYMNSFKKTPATIKPSQESQTLSNVANLLPSSNLNQTEMNNSESNALSNLSDMSSPDTLTPSMNNVSSQQITYSQPSLTPSIDDIDSATNSDISSALMQ